MTHSGIRSVEQKFSIVLFTPFLIVILAIFLRILHSPSCTHWDAAVAVQEAELILSGKLPYVDFLNVQPPLMYYFYAPAVLFAKALSIPLPIACPLFMGLLVLYSVLVSFAIGYESAKQHDFDYQILLPVVYGVLIFNLAVYFHFGVKDHIFILTFIPYFLLRWLRRENQSFSRPFALLVGIMAAVGISLKTPCFLTISVALEIYWCLARGNTLKRLRDPEFLMCNLLVVLYPVLYISLCPDTVRTALLTRWIPFGLKGYEAYSQPLDQLLSFTADVPGRCITSMFIIVLVCTIGLFIRKKSSLVAPLIIWTLAGFVIYLWQAKGWQYQTIPMAVGFFMLANLELFLCAKWLVAHKSAITFRRPIAAFSLYSLMLFGITPLLINDSMSTAPLTDELEGAITRYTHVGDPVLILSQWMRPAYPCLLQTDRKPASRYLWSFPLKMCEFLKHNAKNSYERKKYAEMEKRIVGEIYEDIDKTHPRLIVIAPGAINPPYPTSIWSYLETHGFEKVLSDYAPLGIWNQNYLWLRDTDR